MSTVISISYTDDLDGEPLLPSDIQFVEWTWRGERFVLETSAGNLDAIESGATSFATVLARSREVPPRRLTKARHLSKRSESSSMTIRVWARQNGHRVAERGRIPAAILAAFAATQIL
ncbi:histone-like nucleoid-structuring protein Lsr2 [Williamsia sp.]|uniref:Lsr2 family DNA-binding protein n=1 Tax=Williamsia sp. TaxID=1872085 RepID=UPI001A285B3E|nr:histone-like nucleoid-structuring protein Lsr2 [Williamsia sp.]MBJ7289530.1 Lsr2 family protein [Williamsia sp.]